MLAAEFFEKTYRNDDHRSIAAPANDRGIESKSAKTTANGRRRIANSTNGKNNNTNRDGLSNFAVLVSEAYRQECTMNNPVRSEEQVHFITTNATGRSNTPGTASKRPSDRKSRTSQREIPQKSSTRNQVKDRQTRSTKKTHRQQPLKQDQERHLEKLGSPAQYRTPVKEHRQTDGHYSSSTDASPIGVMDEYVSLRGALSKQHLKKKKKQPVVPPNTIEVPMAGILDIHDQILLQERCEQEKILNRELKQKVLQLQNQISSLQKSTKQGDKTLKAKINQYEDCSNEDEESSDDGPNVSRDCSGILEECLVPISSSPRPIETISPEGHTTSQNNSKRHYRTQLEESKKIIQMLFGDLKISKQKESDLATKLKAANMALHKEKQRSRENTKIAMKSADDVRARLHSKLQHDANRNDRLSLRGGDNNTEEVERLKQELAQAREECLRWKRKEQLARRSTEAATTITMHRADRKEEEKFSTLRRSQLLENHTRIAQNEATKADRKSRADQIENDETLTTSQATEEEQNLETPAGLIQKEDQTKEQSKMMGTCSTTDNEYSILPNQRLDFFSCVSNPGSPSRKTNTFVDSIASHNSQDSNAETLGELMKELKASKERLHAADEKLNRLVNKDGLLLDSKVGRNCDSPKFDGSIDVVKSSNTGIEVSRQSCAYF